MTTILLLVVFLSNGEIIQSPGFEYSSKEKCEERAHKIERDWFGKPGINGIQWQCIPVQTPEKWITKEDK
jgi:hypothetical protein